MLTLNDGRNELWQWDTGRKLTVDADCSQVHFSNKVFGRSIDVDVVDGTVAIPDVLLQVDNELIAWAFVGTPENGYTKISKVFKVNKRNKPADYVFTPPEQTTLGQIMKRLDRIEESQDPDAIKNAVDDYLANNPIKVEEKDPTVPEWAKQPTPPDVKIPDKLPNPHSITFTGAVNASYDGSDPVEITIPDSGGNVDLTGYAKEQWVQENYQPKGDYALKSHIPTVPTKVSAFENDKGYLTQHQDISHKLDANKLPEAVNTALAQAKASGEFDGAPGEKGDKGDKGDQGEPGNNGITPVRGIDYWNPDDIAAIEAYIATELAKRGQLKPEFAESKEWLDEGNGDTTKLYVLPDGYIYAYMPYIAEGGASFTNLADPNSEEWLTGYRFNASSELDTSPRDNAFVSNYIPCKAGNIIRVKGVADYDSTLSPAESLEPFFKIKPFDVSLEAMGSSKLAYYLTQPHSVVGTKACAGVEIDDDGVLSYEILLRHSSANATSNPSFSADIEYVRISGVYTGASAEDVIITVNEEITYSEDTEEYRWANTGHAFVPANYEDRIDDLEAEDVKINKKIDNLQKQIDSGEASAKSGAKWFALGDSITQGYIGYIKDDGSAGCKMASSSCWAKLVSEMNGYELTNHGVGGTGYAHGDNNARAVVDTIDFTQCDFVTLAYGVNDWKYSAPIGTMDDDIETGGTMVSNMRYVIKKIMQDNPLCKIFVITPINCKPSGNFTYAMNWGIDAGGHGLLQGYGLAEIFELMQQVCRYHGIEMIDMTFNSCVNRENLETILPDGVHPSVEGHKLMARELAQKIVFR